MVSGLIISKLCLIIITNNSVGDFFGINEETVRFHSLSSSIPNIFLWFFIFSLTAHAWLNPGTIPDVIKWNLLISRTKLKRIKTGNEIGENPPYLGRNRNMSAGNPNALNCALRTRSKRPDYLLHSCSISQLHYGYCSTLWPIWMAEWVCRTMTS